MDSKNGGPAFPHLVEHCQLINETEMYPGVTIRDYFAGQALALLGHQYNDSCAANLSEVPHEAYQIADAMLAERQKGQGE